MKATTGSGQPTEQRGTATGSWASSPATRRSMQGHKSRDTKPELAVRRLLHSQ